MGGVVVEEGGGLIVEGDVLVGIYGINNYGNYNTVDWEIKIIT